MEWLSQRTPTVSGELLYAASPHGELACLEAASGKERWRKNYRMDFNGRRPAWGYCDYPLVDGDRLICSPGGPEAGVVALDKKTGAELWRCAPSFDGETDRPGASYASAVISTGRGSSSTCS